MMCSRCVLPWTRSPDVLAASDTFNLTRRKQLRKSLTLLEVSTLMDAMSTLTLRKINPMIDVSLAEAEALEEEAEEEEEAEAEEADLEEEEVEDSVEDVEAAEEVAVADLQERERLLTNLS
jgi:hypothetical protein